MTLIKIFEVTILIRNAADLGDAVQLDFRLRVLDLVQKLREKGVITAPRRRAGHALVPKFHFSCAPNLFFLSGRQHIALQRFKKAHLP